MRVNPELVFALCWVGRTYESKNRQETVRQ